MKLEAHDSSDIAMGIREREREHNGADLEAQKHRNEAEAGSMTSHYFVKWQRRIFNSSGTDTCNSTVTCAANGTSSNGNSNIASTTGTGTATGSTSLVLVLQLVLQFLLLHTTLF